MKSTLFLAQVVFWVLWCNIGCKGDSSSQGETGPTGPTGASNSCAGKQAPIIQGFDISPTKVQAGCRYQLVINGESPDEDPLTYNVIGTGGHIEPGSSLNEFNYTPEMSVGVHTLLAVVSDNCHITTKSLEIGSVESSWAQFNSRGLYSGDTDDMVFVIHNDTPYLAFQDKEADCRGAVMAYNGAAWHLLNDYFSAGKASQISMRLDNDNLYVAYSDDACEGKATVASYESGDWSAFLNSCFSEGPARYTQLFVSEGTPFVALMDPNAPYNGGVVYKPGLLPERWEYIGGPSGVSDDKYADEIRISVSEGTPYVSYISGDSLVVKNFIGGSWQEVGDPFAEGVAWYPSLFVHNGTPYLSFRNDALPDSNLSVMRFNSSAVWEYVGDPRVSSEETSDTSVYVVNDAAVYVAYKKSGLGIEVKKYNGLAWEAVGTPGFDLSDGLA